MNTATTLRRPVAQPLNRVVLALGTALVAWSLRGDRIHPAPDAATLDLQRAARRDRELIAARRDLGINQLLR